MIYVKTELGSAAIRNRRTVALSFGQRAALILFEGTRTLDTVLESTRPLGVTVADIHTLVDLRLITPLRVDVAVFGTAATVSTPGDSPLAWITLPAPLENHDQRALARPRRATYRMAYQLATELTASLGARGSELHLDVEAAESIEGLVDLLPRLRDVAGERRVRPLAQALEGRQG